MSGYRIVEIPGEGKYKVQKKILYWWLDVRFTMRSDYMSSNTASHQSIKFDTPEEAENILRAIIRSCCYKGVSIDSFVLKRRGKMQVCYTAQYKDNIGFSDKIEEIKQFIDSWKKNS